MSRRITRIDYFMRLATVIAERATCKKLKVGAVLVNAFNNQIVSTGYNGGVSGTPHCIDTECMIVSGHCVRTIHAELNAVLHLEHQYNYLTLYTTHQPCYQCTKALLGANVKEVYYDELFGDPIRDRILREIQPQHKFSMWKVLPR